MVLEGAVAVGSISILTIIITKLKCYAKKNGSCNYGFACMDKPLLDDDDVSIKTVEMDGIHFLHVAKTNNHHEESEYETDSD